MTQLIGTDAKKTVILNWIAVYFGHMGFPVAAKDMTFSVLFDELFKGTNVRDAYDATLEITGAFSEYRRCCYIISTHIIEVGAALRESCDNIRFAYLPTVMDGPTPRYTYRLTEGVTNDRHGMRIIDNEGIPDILSGETEPFLDRQSGVAFDL